MDMQKAFRDLFAGTKLYKVWLFQAWHELSAKFKRTFLGSLWIAGQFVASSLALSIVFGGIMGQSLQEVLPYIMGGILAYNLVTLPLNGGAEVFVGAAGIIRNHAHPYTYYVYEVLAKNFMEFAHNTVVYLILMVIVGAITLPHWSIIITLPLALITVFCWMTVTGLAAARFRDLRFLAPFLGSLLFFMTPIFWNAEHMTGPRSVIVQYNPVYGLVEFIRSPLMGKIPPQICWNQVLILLAVGVIAWVLSFSAFRRRIAFWV